MKNKKPKTPKNYMKVGEGCISLSDTQALKLKKELETKNPKSLMELMEVLKCLEE